MYRKVTLVRHRVLLALLVVLESCHSELPAETAEAAEPAAEAVPQPTPRADEKSVHIKVCEVGKVDMVSFNASWNAALAKIMLLNWYTYPDVAPIKMTFGRCEGQEERSCRARRDEVVCGGHTLSRLLQASALFSAQYWTMQGEGGTAAGRKYPALPFNANVALADALSEGSDAPTWVTDIGTKYHWVPALVGQSGRVAEAMRLRLINPEDQSNEIPLKWPAPALAMHTFVVAASEVIGFVLGHELAHAYGRCAFSQPSILETDGSFDRVVALQLSGALGGKGLDASELAADRCALRALEALDFAHTTTSMKLFPDSNGKDQAMWMQGVGRKIAIEGFSWLFNVGLGDRSSPKALKNGELLTEFVTIEHEGYLHQALRSLLFTMLLNKKEQAVPKQIRVCGEEALPFVLALEDSIQKATLANPAAAARAYQEISKIGGDVLPPGVHNRLLGKNHTFTRKLPNSTCAD
jgi:hypothetical protein